MRKNPFPTPIRVSYGIHRAGCGKNLFSACPAPFHEYAESNDLLFVLCHYRRRMAERIHEMFPFKKFTTPGYASFAQTNPKQIDNSSSIIGVERTKDVISRQEIFFEELWSRFA